MSNRLAQETSPYLLQHAENPVNWYPWGEEAFERAKRENKPVFLSVGYSTCHWCHVMAKESFENEEIAALLNQYFVSVKVDREERPDVDNVYMEASVALTGSGGWPASFFLTPEKKPFFAGTYFPPRTRHGITGLRELLLKVAKKWERDPSKLRRNAEEIVAFIKERKAEAPHPSFPFKRGRGPYGVRENPVVQTAVSLFYETFDPEHGGFGDAPKFPSPHNLLFLLAYSHTGEDRQALAMVETTLTKMRLGGLFDHIGYGFSRYSTDRSFLVPHFEKMLYDNALLMLAYAAAYAVTKRPLYLDTAEKIGEYVLREMTCSQGGFYSAEDADSDGMEGSYYLFGYEEILSLLGEETGRRFNEYYGISEQGNFDGRNIPNRLHGEEAGNAFDSVLPTLYEYRRNRARLPLDDKILTAWNAMMIAAFALLFRVTGKSNYFTAAQNAERFIREKLAEGNRLFVSFREGVHGENGFLDDYAFYAAALLGLYEATSFREYLTRAQEVCKEAMVQFGDGEGDGFYLSGRENERLILASKETYDGAVPSGNSMMAYNLVRLSQLTHDAFWERAAQRQLAFLSEEARAYPAGHSMFLLSLLVSLDPPPAITVVLEKEAVWEEVKKQLPLYADVTVLPVPTEGRPLKNGRTTFYVCKGSVCLPPCNRLSEAWKEGRLGR